MRKWLFIWCGLCASLGIGAESLTATIDTYAKASLSGDVPSVATVSFSNSSESKGKVGQGETAELTIKGLSLSTIQSITLYVRSLQASGGAIVTMCLNDSCWTVAEGAYKDWPGIGNYSTDYQPLSCLNSSSFVPANTSLKLRVDGLTNSVNIQQLVVEYTLAPPSAHTVTLQWMSVTGQIRTQQLTETAIGSGVDLPAVPPEDAVITHEDETWQWIGWTEHPISAQSTSPLFWETNDWYGADADVTLYALYSNEIQQTVTQDSSFTSGEYAMTVVLVDQPYALVGAWDHMRITMQTVPVETDESGEMQWKLTHLSNQYRYQLTFIDDSVTIQHVGSGQWIGYTSTAGSNKYCKWAWCKTAQGSLMFYSHPQSVTADTIYASCLAYSVDLPTEVYYGAYVPSAMFPTHVAYWRLFPLEDIPTTSQPAVYTTFGAASQLPSVHSTTTPLIRKYLDRQGNLIFTINNHSFTILKQQLL